MINRLYRLGGMLAFAAASAFAWGVDTPQHKTAGGIEVFYGVVPGEVVQTHVKEHSAAPMHKKVFFARGTHHLVVTLYDTKTSERINDAKVTATVTPLGLAPETKTLDVMKINDTISYGNYFSMSPGDTPYRVVLSIERPPGHSAITTEFDYRHGTSR